MVQHESAVVPSCDPLKYVVSASKQNHQGHKQHAQNAKAIGNVVHFGHHLRVVEQVFLWEMDARSQKTDGQQEENHQDGGFETGRREKLEHAHFFGKQFALAHCRQREVAPEGSGLSPVEPEPCLREKGRGPVENSGSEKDGAPVAQEHHAKHKRPVFVGIQGGVGLVPAGQLYLVHLDGSLQCAGRIGVAGVFSIRVVRLEKIKEIGPNALRLAVVDEKLCRALVVHVLSNQAPSHAFVYVFVLAETFGERIVSPVVVAFPTDAVQRMHNVIGTQKHLRSILAPVAEGHISCQCQRNEKKYDAHGATEIACLRGGNWPIFMPGPIQICQPNQASLIVKAANKDKDAKLQAAQHMQVLWSLDALAHAPCTLCRRRMRKRQNSSRRAPPAPLFGGFYPCLILQKRLSFFSLRGVQSLLVGPQTGFFLFWWPKVLAGFFYIGQHICSQPVPEG